MNRADNETRGELKDRLRYWRRDVLGLSQPKLCERLNHELPLGDKIPVTTLSNYERGTEPPASFIEVLKRAFPHLNLNWLLMGEGEATEFQEIARRAQEELPESPKERMPKGGLGALGAAIEAVGLPAYMQRLPLAIRQGFFSTVSNLRWAQMRLPSAVQLGSSQTAGSVRFGHFERELGELLLKPFDLLPFSPPSYDLDSSPIRYPGFERYLEAMLLAINLATAVEHGRLGDSG